MRLNYVNGLKGIGCVLVSVGHMAAILLPSLYFGAGCENHTRFEPFIYETPLNMLFNSSSALMCFLLLSGFVIPLKKYNKGEGISVLNKWIEKYFRFMPMALIGILFGWFIMKLGLVYSYKMMDLSYSYSYASIYNNFEPAGLFEINGPIFEGIIRVFWLNSQINSPLGTLKYIWQYSFLLLIFAKWVTDWKCRDCIYGITIISCFYVGQLYKYEIFYLGAMLLGMWVCDGLFNPKRKKHLDKIPQSAAMFFLGIGLILLSVPVANPLNGIYRWVSDVPINHTLYWIIGWALIVLAIANLSFLQKMLSSSILLKLGKVSFAYFAVHWPIIISFSCILTLFMYNKLHFTYTIAALSAMGISILVIFLMALFVQDYVYKYLYKVEQFILRKLVEE